MPKGIIRADLVKHQFHRKDYTYDGSKYGVGKRTNRELLLKDARKVAKATNQRLLRLEREGLTDAEAYKGAINALKGKYDKGGKFDSTAVGHVKNGRPRFKENVSKMTNDELRQLLRVASHTQNAKTSTIAGAKARWEATQRSFQKMLDNAGVNFQLTLNNAIEIAHNKAWQEARKRYGYKVTLQTTAEAQKQGKDVGKLLADALEKNMDVAQIIQFMGLDKNGPDFSRTDSIGMFEEFL